MEFGHPIVFIVMGVSGCGKSTVGAALAEQIGAPFFDGDDFHPPANVRKMSMGMPLDDDDRAPWLATLHGLVKEHLREGQSAVIACSALKERYREQLRGGLDAVMFVYLRGSFDTIQQRMLARSGHFMPPEMLKSQFDALEEPSAETAIIVSIEDSISQIVDAVIAQTTQKARKKINE